MAPVLLSTTRCATALSCYLIISMFLLVCQGAALLCFWLYFGYLLLFFLSWTSSISFFLLKVVFPILKHFLFRWISLPAPKELTTTLGLSQSACEMFLVLKDHLCTMEGQLSKLLFDRFWHRLSRNIDEFLFKEVSL